MARGIRTGLAPALAGEIAAMLGRATKPNAEIALDAGVTPQTIRNLARGKVNPTIGTVHRIALAAGYDIKFVRRKRPRLRVVAGADAHD
jgi:transcriptional regulator with XRE-family HTH domain